MVLLALPPADHLLIERDRGQFVPSRRAKMRCSFPRRSFRARVASHRGPPAHLHSYACRGAVSSREGKEPRTTPGGAGDGAGDGRQALISRALPVEAIGDDGDGVALALIVANEHRAGLEAAPWRAAVPRQP